ncbi:MAG: phosphoglycerate mutase family protein [Actinomycetota bacterium]
MSEDRVYLVRHAKAGSRSRWEGDDRLRPLSKPGELQARKLQRAFATIEVTHVSSSSYTRCVETVRPIAEERGLQIEIEPSFVEGAATAEALDVLRVVPPGTVICSHGDMIPAVVEYLAADGLVIDGTTAWRKASTWILERRGGRFVRGRYVPPPEEG